MWRHDAIARAGLSRSLAGLAAALSIAAGSAAAQSPPATNLHTPAPPGIVHQESDAAQVVTSVIKCACGGCVNQTLHECECGYASQEKARIEDQLTGGATPEQLIAGYISMHGPQIRIVPERTGLGMVGYLMPFAAALIGITALLAVLWGWRRRTAGAEAGAPATPSEADRPYLERLARDLGKLDA